MSSQRACSSCARGVEQRVAHRHRRGRAEQRETLDARRCRARAARARTARRANGRRPRSARAPMVAIASASQSAIASTLACGGPAERPWPGRSTASTFVAVMGEVARLQRPHAVVVAGAVDEHDRRQRGVERPRAGVRVDAPRSRTTEAHQAFPAACSARPRSSIRSSGSSRPTDSRIVPSVMPALAQVVGRHAEMRRRRGMDDQRLRVADVGQMREQAQRLDEACGPASRVPRRLKLNTAPQPRGSSRCASA